ncbi:MAG: hypothetical protein N2Z76_01730 [Treponemataceae bacterium]|nr:hypothetical protein [Treponemataceae bacterium]
MNRIPRGTRGSRGLLLLSVLCLVAGGLFSSCWHPPFDPAVSASFRGVERLGAPLVEVTCYGNGNSPLALSYWPVKEGTNFDFTKGLVVREYSDKTRISFVDNLLSSVVLSDGSFCELPVVKDERPWLFQYGSNGMVYGLHLGYKAVIQQKPPPQGGSSFFSLSINQINQNLLLGCGSLTQTAGNDAVDTVYIGGWWRDTSSVDLYIHKAGNDINNNTTQYTNLPSPPELPEGSFWIAKYPSDESQDGPVYISYRVQGSSTVVTYRWNWNGSDHDPPQKLPIPYRITRMLSTGALVAELSTKMIVYDRDGNYRYTIPTGNLRFIHEVWQNATLGGGGYRQMLFSRVLQWRTNKEEQKTYNAQWKYQIQVYAIPTTELGRLAQ